MRRVQPNDIVDWMCADDVVARDRAFAAVLEMGKLDVARLREAFAG